MEIAFLLSFGQFLLLVCYLVSVSLLSHNVMISTRARFAALQVNGVERNRSVCRRRVVGEPDASTRAFTLQRQPDVSISTACMLFSQRITFTPQCHDFYARAIRSITS